MKTMLKFFHLEFRDGINTTVRRGALDLPKILILTDINGKVIGNADVLCVRHITFRRLQSEQLANEHDPACRDLQGMYEAMQFFYNDFTEDEVVSVIDFKPRIFSAQRG